MRKIKPTVLAGSNSKEPAAYEAQHARLARKAAAEGMVLLKNEGGTLPLAKGSSVALYGAGVCHTVKGGTGSGDVNERNSIAILKGMEDAGYHIANREWIAEYEKQYDNARLEWKRNVEGKMEKIDADPMWKFFLAYSSTPFYMPAGNNVKKEEADLAVYVLSRIAGEAADRKAVEGDYYISKEEHEIIADICKCYQKVLVIINAGGVVDLSFVDEFPQITSVLVSSQPGMEGGHAVADVISGDITPCGKLTDTWAMNYEDYPNALTFSHRNGNVEKEYYEEGIYVGYRYFDTFDVPVRYGFGYGLSYTDFNLQTIGINVSLEGQIAVSVRVTNIGECYKGKEVVQIYAALPIGKVEKEYRRLCTFAKTKELAPGESQILELKFTLEEMASYDEKQSGWILEAGDYAIFVGSSLENSKCEAVLRFAQDYLLSIQEHICPLKETLTEKTQGQEILKKRQEQMDELVKKVPVICFDSLTIETVKMDYQEKEIEDEASQLVKTLSEDELIGLTTGDPFKGQGSALGSAGVSVPGSAGETSICALEKGIANIVLADGPAGLRLNQVYYVQDGLAKMLPLEASMERGFFYSGDEPEGEKYYQFCTAIPVGTLLAQTWDIELLEEVGKMIGKEMEIFGVTLWLAPGMNIHRNPLCGRNFEYYSEDPLISGKMAAAMTRGVQSMAGCGTTIKHFACNNQEDNRMHSDSILSERTLREIYLRGFGIAIKESQPLSLMTSYNSINGVHAANNYDLCTKAARCEFGFEGVIMTDWTTTEQDETCTAAGCMRAGNDIIMPGTFGDQDSIRRGLADGSVTKKQLTDCITRLVRVILKSNRYE